MVVKVEKEMLIPPPELWNRPAIVYKLRYVDRTAQNQQLYEKQSKVIFWQNATQQYGLIYVLSNHQIGIYFNDASTMITSTNKKYLPNHIGKSTICSEKKEKSYNKPFLSMINRHRKKELRTDFIKRCKSLPIITGISAKCSHSSRTYLREARSLQFPYISSPSSQWTERWRSSR